MSTCWTTLTSWACKREDVLDIGGNSPCSIRPKLSYSSWKFPQNQVVPRQLVVLGSKGYRFWRFLQLHLQRLLSDLRQFPNYLVYFHLPMGYDQLVSLKARPDFVLTYLLSNWKQSPKLSPPSHLCTSLETPMNEYQADNNYREKR